MSTPFSQDVIGQWEVTLVNAAKSLFFLCCFAAAFIKTPTLASESNSQAPAQTACDIHIWQRGIYRTEAAPSSGLIGALLQAGQDGKNSPDSVEDLMQQEFNIQALPTVLNKMALQNYTKSAVNNLIFEQQNIGQSDFDNIKSSISRNTTSQSNCYIEIYIDRQTFSRGPMWSRLFSDIYARTFYLGRYMDKSATVSKNVRSISITDEMSRNKARERFRDAFIDNLSEFLQYKLPKR